MNRKTATCTAARVLSLLMVFCRFRPHAVQDGPAAFVSLARSQFLRGGREAQGIRQVGGTRDEVGQRRPTAPEEARRCSPEKHGRRAGGRRVGRAVRRRQSR